MAGLLGAATGALTSDDKAKGAIVGGAIGAGVGAGIGYNLDKQEAELRNELGTMPRCATPVTA